MPTAINHDNVHADGQCFLLHFSYAKIINTISMEPSSILILIAIVLLGVAIMGGGTMVFCCHGFERGLPFLSIRELYDELGDLDRRTTARYRDFAVLINHVAGQLQRGDANIPRQHLVKETSTITEDGKTAVGCQNTPTRQIMVAPARGDFVISIPDE